MPKQSEKLRRMLIQCRREKSNDEIQCFEYQEASYNHISHPSITLIFSIHGLISRGDCLYLDITPTTIPVEHSNATDRDPFAAACMAYSICLMAPLGLKALTDWSCAFSDVVPEEGGPKCVFH